MKRHHDGLIAVVAFAFMFSLGCSDSDSNGGTTPPDTGPPEAAAGFVGYDNVETGDATCGNCHVSRHGLWQETAHADAWAGLQDSGHAQPFCEDCHTVGQLGNVTNTPGGWATTMDARYQDVQCESCHGPGENHVATPDGGTIPLAPMDVGTDLEQGCGQCHQGSHHPFVEQWAQSGHGSVVAYPAGRDGCKSCHTGQDALLAWGVNADYVEREDALAGEHIPITCGVCHDPHGSPNAAQLRFPIDVADENQNLCAQCHHKRGQPDPSTFRGPHSPEGPVVFGTAGWWPGDQPSNLVGTHGNETANPGLCAGCHVNKFDVTDPNTGDFLFTNTGHLFDALPCLDENGVPTGEPCDDEEQTYKTCADGGCHATEQLARDVTENADSRITTLAGTLNTGLEALQPNWQACYRADNCDRTFVDSDGNTRKYFDYTDGYFTKAEGSAFNYHLALYPGSVVHNARLMEALLTTSIREIEDAYGVAPRADVNLDRLLIMGAHQP